jgi:hypothetical protein
MAVAQTALLAFILQFIYEYLGVNAMIYESSARYMKGTTLDKFSNVASAKCYLVYNRLRELSTEDIRVKLDANLDVLEVIIKQKAARKLLKNFPAKPDEMTTREYDDIMTACSGDIEKYRNIMKLADILDEYTIRWLLLNGFNIADKSTVRNMAYRDGLAELEADLTKPADYIKIQYGTLDDLNKRIVWLKRALSNQ